jgi:hypothetical protein
VTKSSCLQTVVPTDLHPPANPFGAKYKHHIHSVSSLGEIEVALGGDLAARLALDASQCKGAVRDAAACGRLGRGAVM